MDFTGLNARRMVCEAARTDRVFLESMLNSASIPSNSGRTNKLHLWDFQRLFFPDQDVIICMQHVVG